tara:strand:- start:748 stop:1200 length:453 start_codon:yes stop_codon:yes gene_type:complete
MKPLIHLNYTINKDILLLESDKARKSAKPWHHKNEVTAGPSWLVSYYTSEYIENIMKDLNIKGSPRFYFQQPHFHLKPHRDYGTQCAVNFILNGTTPINIEGKEYVYSQALVNVQKEHSIRTDNEERIMLKFSIKDKSFEEVLNNIKYIK